jgi:hypothetical protein
MKASTNDLFQVAAMRSFFDQNHAPSPMPGNSNKPKLTLGDIILSNATPRTSSKKKVAALLSLRLTRWSTRPPMVRQEINSALVHPKSGGSIYYICNNMNVTSVCEWTVVVCNEDDLVVNLDLGKSTHEEVPVLIFKILH